MNPAVVLVVLLIIGAGITLISLAATNSLNYEGDSTSENKKITNGIAIFFGIILLVLAVIILNFFSKYKNRY